PNPSFGNFTIDLKDIKASVKGIIFYDNAGRILQEHKNIKGSSIQINASYPAGTFFVQINTDKGFAIQKVLIGQ
ncbi:MAG: T9SS type A sorting domain-containing protein, partial [Saprospiraceae bacterium]